MTLAVTTHRYNWMGVEGTESQELDLALMRGAEGLEGNNTFDRRQAVIEEIKERLYLVKRDLDLIPEEELRAEEEARRRRREECERREQEKRHKEEQERERQATEAHEREQRQKEEEVRRAREELARAEEQRVRAAQAARMRDVSDSDADSDEDNEFLGRIQRSQAEIDHAVGFVTNGTRMLLATRGATYVSYLDGSLHTTLDSLDMHNEVQRDATAESLEGTNVTLPYASEFDAQGLRDALLEHKCALRKLEAHRCRVNPAYALKIPASEKNVHGVPTEEVMDADGDEHVLLAQVTRAKQAVEDARRSYNARATACAQALCAAGCGQ